jgi:hypothetical protein
MPELGYLNDGPLLDGQTSIVSQLPNLLMLRYDFMELQLKMNDLPQPTGCRLINIILQERVD